MSKAITQREYETFRVGSAVVGSQWVYFKDDDDELKDLWAAHGIEIVCVITPGVLFMAKRCDDESLPPELRTVKYSELW